MCKLPPTETRLLDKWGYADKIVAVAHAPANIVMRSCKPVLDHNFHSFGLQLADADGTNYGKTQYSQKLFDEVGATHAHCDVRHLLKAAMTKLMYPSSCLPENSIAPCIVQHSNLSRLYCKV
jgi:hypothetical protein